MPGLDHGVAMSRVGGDAELLKEIAELFLAESEKTMEELRSAIATGDARAVEHASHGLKGAVANFGAEETVAAAQKLEELGRAGELRDAPAALVTLERALNDLWAELRAL